MLYEVITRPAGFHRGADTGNREPGDCGFPVPVLRDETGTGSNDQPGNQGAPSPPRRGCARSADGIEPGYQKSQRDRDSHEACDHEKIAAAQTAGTP